MDNSLTAGIGRRLDGWPNRDLNVGAIIALSPVVAMNPSLVADFTSWGPGKYDPRLHVFNGTSLIRRHTGTLPVVIPPAYGLRLVEFETFTGDGPISYWNNYVGITQMGGQGNFNDPRIGLSIPQAPDLGAGAVIAAAIALSLLSAAVIWLIVIAVTVRKLLAGAL